MRVPAYAKGVGVTQCHERGVLATAHCSGPLVGCPCANTVREPDTVDVKRIAVARSRPVRCLLA